MMLFEPFILRALAAGIGIALMSGVLGCFIVWQRLAYFGDTIAHAALLGVVLALLLDIPPEAGVVCIALLVAASVAYFQRRQQLGADTLLGIAAHAALALGLVLLSLSRTVTVDINHYLFGDILAVNSGDLLRIWLCAFVVLAIVRHQWRDLMRITLHPDIAQVEGVNTQRTRLALMLVIALVVAVSIKIVGMLLITSLLILPAACARGFARTPTQMVLAATLAGIFAVTGGLSASALLDTPSGPSIILAAMALFLGTAFAKRLMNSR